jgi:acetyl-CoA acetyltransferase
VISNLIPNHARRFLLPRQNPSFGKFTTRDSLETDGLWDVYNNFGMGNCGEAAATKFKISRESQDAHAIESYKRAARAWADGVFDAEVAPVTIKGKKGDTIVKRMKSTSESSSRRSQRSGRPSRRMVPSLLRTRPL